MRRLVPITRASLIAVLIAGCTTPAPTATPVPPTATPMPTPAGPTTFAVKVGAETLSLQEEYDTFLPEDVTLNAGDTINFVHTTAEPHTISFNPPEAVLKSGGVLPPDSQGRVEADPKVFFPTFPAMPGAFGQSQTLSTSFDGAGYMNSGVLSGTNDAFKVTFSKAGTYPYICLFHVDHMKGTITVNPPGTKYPKTQAELDKAGDEHLTQHKAAATALRATLKNPAPEAGPGGGKKHHVFAAAVSPKDGNDIYTFIGGENLSIKAGDSVQWGWGKNAPGVPHTVTFLSGAKAPDLFAPEMQPNGPPRLYLNQAVAAPSGTGTYDGTGVASSGFVITGGPMPQQYLLTFSKPGTYKYLCLLHDPVGMNGTINVTQ